MLYSLDSIRVANTISFEYFGYDFDLISQYLNFHFVPSKKHVVSSYIAFKLNANKKMTQGLKIYTLQIGKWVWLCCILIYLQIARGGPNLLRSLIKYIDCR